MLRITVGILFVMLAVVGMTVSSPTPVRADAIKSLVIIVNVGNGDSKVKDNKVQLADIKNYFLLKESKWGDTDKTEVKVFPMVSSTDEAKFFLRKALGMSEDELAKHWNKKKEQEGIDQPKGRKDNAEVFRLVSKDTATGALGYLDKAYYDGLGEDDKKKIKTIYTVTDN